MSQGSAVGIEQGLHKVAEVVFGCLVGLCVSLLMSKVWLIQPEKPQPAQPMAEAAEQPRQPSAG